MIKKIENVKIHRYSIEDDGFFVDAIEFEENGERITEFNISHKNYGLTELMFGLNSRDVSTEEEIIDLIERNVYDYIALYKKEYFD